MPDIREAVKHGLKMVRALGRSDAEISRFFEDLCGNAFIRRVPVDPAHLRDKFEADIGEQITELLNEPERN